MSNKTRVKDLHQNLKLLARNEVIKELKEKGNEVDADQLIAELKERDNKDLTRSVGPLKKADDAIFIDSTHLSIEGVIEEMLKYIKNK